MTPEQIAFLERESERARYERANKRLWILCIILAVLLAASWLGFVIYEAQYETVTTSSEVEQYAEGDGDYQMVGGDYYGGQAES